MPHLFGKDDTAFWKNFDWDKAITTGLEARGFDYSGEHGWVETRYYWPITHMVAPKEDTVQCNECHTQGGRLDELTGFYMPGRDSIPWLTRLGWLGAALALDRSIGGRCPNHGAGLAHGLIAYNRIERRWCNELSARTRLTTPIEVDGAIGEDGGQVLRSALSLSLLTGQPFRLSCIRANRDRRGLRPQHLVAVQTAARVAFVEVRGDRVGSEAIAFAPEPVQTGDYFFDIGTAGATSLVLQTLLLLPLALAPGTSSVTIRGGTHVPWSPCFHYLN